MRPAYDLVAGWPQNYCGAGHVIGSTAGIWAESPDRVFIFSRGCLPELEGRRAARPTASSRRATPRATTCRRRIPRHPRWDHIVNIVDRNGKLIESWEQHNKLFVRPHRVLVNPYDPERHVWLVDDGAHAIYKFTRDGKKLVMTVGTPMQPGNDETHFTRPTDVAWLPDGTFFVSDGYVNTRVVKFDKNGKFILTWGQKGNEPNETRPSYMNTVHAIAIDKDRSLRQRPGQLAHPGLRRERQVPRRVAECPPAVFVPVVRRSASVGGRRHHAEVHQVRPERQAALLVGHVWRVPGRLLGRAPVPRGQRRQSLHRRRPRRPAAEVPSEEGRQPGAHHRPLLAGRARTEDGETR